ncbi:hypothetical protein K7W42_20330 [Deinococcus sp. HMF7604]|uniref:hypothetical protein n=1 Tax=Deinococcus betulae TaxID=2873312 RepID=UPI001CCDC1AF|nr:hypothetical protein [Deinococcus betulae]MBZ9753187.1 hypothetical protein [Deinococcus betulae]
MNELEQALTALAEAQNVETDFYKRMDAFIEGMKYELQKQRTAFDRAPNAQLTPGTRSPERLLVLRVDGATGKKEVEFLMSQKGKGNYIFRCGDWEANHHSPVDAMKALLRTLVVDSQARINRFS